VEDDEFVVGSESSQVVTIYVLQRYAFSMGMNRDTEKIIVEVLQVAVIVIEVGSETTVAARSEV
jgi:hypothetical protein